MAKNKNLQRKKNKLKNKILENLLDTGQQMNSKQYMDFQKDNVQETKHMLHLACNACKVLRSKFIFSVSWL